MMMTNALSIICFFPAFACGLNFPNYGTFSRFWHTFRSLFYFSYSYQII